MGTHLQPQAESDRHGASSGDATGPGGLGVFDQPRSNNKVPPAPVQLEGDLATAATQADDQSESPAPTLSLSRTVQPAATDDDIADDISDGFDDDDWQSLLDDSIPALSLSKARERSPLAEAGSDSDFEGFFADSEEVKRSQTLTRAGIAGAMVVCLAVVAALLVPSDNIDEAGSDTAADTESAVAESQVAEGAPENFAPGNGIEPFVDRPGVRGPGDLSGTDGDDDSDDGTTTSLDDEDAADGDTSDDADDDGTTTSTSEADDSTDGSLPEISSTTSTTADPTSTSTTAAESTTSTTEAPTTTSTEAPATTTTAAPTTSTTAPPCNGASWDLVMQDDFNGSSLNTGAWAPYNSSGNAGYGLRRPEAISVNGGILTITASMQNGTLVSGGMQHRHNQQYGRYEFKVRTDQDFSEATSGVVLTWPQSNAHPRDGENNIYETLATPGDRHEFYTFIHKPYGSVHDQDYTVHSTSSASWHTMAMEWTPGWIKLYRDGSLVKTIDETSADLIPDNPHFLAIQFDAWKHSVGSTVTMQVDYVKVWSYRNGC